MSGQRLRVTGAEMSPEALKEGVVHASHPACLPMSFSAWQPGLDLFSSSLPVAARPSAFLTLKGNNQRAPCPSFTERGLGSGSTAGPGRIDPGAWVPSGRSGRLSEPVLPEWVFFWIANKRVLPPTVSFYFGFTEGLERKQNTEIQRKHRQRAAPLLCLHPSGHSDRNVSLCPQRLFSYPPW